VKLSVVATLFKSEAYIEEFYSRISSVAQKVVGEDYEIVLINDGCPNDSLELALKLIDYDSHVVVIDLSRNFGHHKAIMTGLENSLGDLVFLIDSDLEEEPEWLIPFWEQLRDERSDVVFGVQNQRKGGWFERLSGKLFYYTMRVLSGLELPSNIVTARLMTRRYVNALLKHREREVFLAGLWHVTGFEQSQNTVVKKNLSQTTYSFRKKLSLLVTSITSFSNIPLVLVFNLGLFVLALSFAFISYLLVRRVFFSESIDGWTSVITSVWLIGGINISFIGLLGIYLSKIYSEIKQRPYTIIREIYGR
jgi:putative glycosyltransferase